MITDSMQNFSYIDLEVWANGFKIRQVNSYTDKSYYTIDNVPNGEMITVKAQTTLIGGAKTNQDEYTMVTMPYIGDDRFEVDHANGCFRFWADFDFNPNVISISECGVIIYDNQELENGTRYYFTADQLQNGAEIYNLQYGLDYFWRYFYTDSFGRYFEQTSIHTAKLEAPPTIDTLTLTSTANNRVNVDITFTPNGNPTNFYLLFNTIDGLGVEYKINLPNSGNQVNVDIFNGMMDSNGKTISITPATTYEFTAYIETQYGNDMMVGIVSTAA